MTPSPTRLVLDRDFTLAPVSPRLFGSFVEHLGRCVYGGIFEPGHPAADRNGFRRDVLDLVRELGVTVIRYPGGNFVSGYRWEDGVGPVEQRPRRRELAWMSTETNRFGTNEFVQWCRLAGVEPMMAVNLGTRGPSEAGEFHEYCNHPGGTELSERRIAHGFADPHDIRLWCLGNEMDGPWQMGHLTAEEYGRRAREAAKLMHFPDVNRSSTPLTPAEFVVCGSSGRGMPTYGQWDQRVLEECFDKVDYLSVHSYVNPETLSREAFLAFPDNMGLLIREVSAICDAVAAKRKSTRRIHLSYDEYNVWYSSRPENLSPAWSEAPPLLENVYTLADSVCLGGMLIALLNHADRVKIACQAQLVNVIGMILTRTGGPAWRQTIFHPFALTSRHGRGTVLRHVLHGPTHNAGGSEVPTLAAAAVLQDTGELNLFIVNRNPASAARLESTLRGFVTLTLQEALTLTGPDLSAVNTEAEPDRVRPAPLREARLDGDRLTAELPAASWNLMRLTPR